MLRLIKDVEFFADAFPKITSKDVMNDLQPYLNGTKKMTVGEKDVKFRKLNPKFYEKIGLNKYEFIWKAW